MKDLKEVIAKKLEEKDLGLNCKEIYDLIEIPPQENMGDFAFPCFTLARTNSKKFKNWWRRKNRKWKCLRKLFLR